ncbi:MAG: LacI family DNA-binding transcriptional regulator [Clostridia bacterium]|nr:LacI family DNA-binding transcriptional regulator [Clostridia bacterium]MBQ4608131.1 LacI family DNA-binding transcriptional regulator [Clostridia bacterium]MBQ7051302.1 LacI family DNA-binding transcriptional regulator [Clostridia bacterium]
MATMDDIARALGITKGTVSKALSGADDVSEAMRRTVVEKAVEMGYSRIARSHAVKKICIFILHMAYKKPDDFGYDVVIGFRKAAEPAGYRVDIIELDDATQRSISYDEFMLRENYQGALILGMMLSDPWLSCMQTCRTPAVLHDNRVRGNPAVADVGIDNDEGMHLAVSHLQSLGHRKIGYLSSGLRSYVYQQRYAAFFDALRQSGLPHHSGLAASESHPADCVRLHLPRLIDEGCTAIMCSHDQLAHEAMLCAAGLGKRIPQDLSFVGFDDIPLCRSTEPPLTTIRQDRSNLGRCAFSALLNLITHVPISMLLLHTDLIVRDSTDAPPSEQA